MKRRTLRSNCQRTDLAFAKGKAAYNANQPLEANPYRQGQVSAFAWSKGWLKGLRDHGRSAA